MKYSFYFNGELGQILRVGLVAHDWEFDREVTGYVAGITVYLLFFSINIGVKRSFV